MFSVILMYTANNTINKLATEKKTSFPAYNSVIYIFPAIFLSMLLCFTGKFSASSGTILLGALTGVFFCITTIFILSAIQSGDIGLTMAIVNLALVVPVIASALIWKHESLSIRKAIGLAFTIAAILLIGTGGKDQ